MSRRRRRRSVQLVKTCSSPSHLLVYNNFIPYMEDLCGTGVSQLALVQLWLHKGQFVFHTYLARFHTNPYNCVRSGLLPYKVKFWRCEGLLLVLGGACGVGRSFAAFGGSCAPGRGIATSTCTLPRYLIQQTFQQLNSYRNVC